MELAQLTYRQNIRNRGSPKAQAFEAGLVVVLLDNRQASQEDS